MKMIRHFKAGLWRIILLFQRYFSKNRPETDVLCCWNRDEDVTFYKACSF